MKRSRVLTFLSILVGVGVVGSVAGAVAWFSPSASIGGEDSPIEGTTEGAYFAYGDGTTLGKAYGISKPRHLYNLAWLTYLGYFKDKQCYFELANDIDLDGWVLPPIGTTQYPFVGNFNGKNYIVSNATMSNQFSDYGTKHPGAVTSTNFDQTKVKIVGFFGVIGEYPDDSYSGTYSSSVNTAYDFGLTNVTVTTYTSDTLIGMVAGYVDADISDIAVDAGNLTVKTGAGTSVISPAKEISEHAILGYTTKEKEVTRVNETIYSVNVSADHEFSATESGNTQGWGGSINMVSLYERIYNMSQISSSISPYTWRTDTVHNANGTTSSQDYPFTSAGDYSVKAYTSRPAAGNLHFMNRSGNAQYRYIGGGAYHNDTYYSYYSHTGKPISDGTNYLTFDGSSLGSTTSESSATLWTMPEAGSSGTISTTYDGTTYYLYNNSGTLVASASNSTTWTVTNQGNSKITISNGNYKIHYYGSAWTLIPTTDSYDTYNVIQYTSGSTTYYISSASTSGSTPSNTTSLDSAAHFLVDGNNYVYFLSGSTKLYLAIYYYSRGLFGSSTELRFINATGTSNYYYFTYSGSTLRASRRSGWSTTYYYVDYSSGWTYDTSSTGIAFTEKQGDTVSYSTMYLSATSSTTHNGPDDYEDTSKNTSGMSYTATNTTYLPLNVTSDGGGTMTSANATAKLASGDYDPTDSNTGYLVAGYTFDGTASSLSETAAHRAANVRVSYYGTKFIQNYSSLVTSGAIQNDQLYTINTSNEIVTVASVSSSFAKYEESKVDFYNNALDGADNVYGMHFMSSQVSVNDVVPATNVSILGESRANPSTSAYQMPVNAIDFNLKQKGYINFFAATFFGGNDSFFSLHQIVRGSDTDINTIKEIEAIYSDGVGAHSYAYKYTDGTFYEPYAFDGTGLRYQMDSSGVATSVEYTDNYAMSSSAFTTSYSAYKPVFYTAQIGVNTAIKQSPYYYTNSNGTYGSMYYFEIPMNSGEFCLGSVADGTGGYLLYLDIGANASKTQRTIVSEHYLLEADTLVYPVGVAFITYSDAGIDDTDSASMTVPTGFAGKTLSVSRSADTLTVTENSTVTLTGDLTYLGDSISIASNIQEKLKPKESHSTEVKRLQYYDYNVNLETVTRTIITDTYTDGAATPSRTIEQYALASDGKTWNAIDEENWKIYQTKNGISYDLSAVASPSSLALNGATDSGGLGWTDPGSTVLLEIKYELEEGVTATGVLTLSMQVDEDNTAGQYYVFKDYAFVLTATGGDVVITVVTKGSGTITVNGTTITAVGQTITVTAS